MAKAKPMRQGHWLMSVNGQRYSQPFEWPEDAPYHRAYSEDALNMLLTRRGKNPATCHDVTDATEFDIGEQIDEYTPPEPKPAPTHHQNGTASPAPQGPMTMAQAAEVLAQFSRDVQRLQAMIEELPHTIKAAQIVAQGITEQFRPLLAVLSSPVGDIQT